MSRENIFKHTLREKGYGVKNACGEGKYMAVKPLGRQRYHRLATLGGNYTEERVRKRILTDTVGMLSSSYSSEDKAGFAKDFFRRHSDAPPHGFQQKHYDKLCHIAKLGKGCPAMGQPYLCLLTADDIDNAKMLTKLLDKPSIMR
jgi:hypothetical protein